ncbi:hypothetical protein [uncultured Ruegeria sp.]|uniref:hypothetical protein n=2 Tax=uncultured Ruegeria sp. TaxID=259304 RepID=UPI00262A2BF6|nr:hypothetical protein [uncultured Ruegeria sp.]
MTSAHQAPVDHRRSIVKPEVTSAIEDAFLWSLEERFWTSGLDSARATTAQNAVMIFPFPPGILQGEQVWDHLQRNTGWRSVVMTDRNTTLRGSIAMLAYRVSAEKAGVPIYEALCASTYLQDEDNWLRISHQQTPVIPTELLTKFVWS